MQEMSQGCHEVEKKPVMLELHIISVGTYLSRDYVYVLIFLPFCFVL